MSVHTAKNLTASCKSKPNSWGGATPQTLHAVTIHAMQDDGLASNFRKHVGGDNAKTFLIFQRGDHHAAVTIATVSASHNLPQ